MTRQLQIQIGKILVTLILALTNALALGRIDSLLFLRIALEISREQNDNKQDFLKQSPMAGNANHIGIYH